MKNRYHIKKSIAVASVAVASLAGLAIAAPVAFAAQDAVPDVAGINMRFQKLDTNHNGVLSRDEVRHIADYGKAFDMADANHDGYLNQDEFIKAESLHDRAQVAAYVDDSVITATVKGSLLKELKSLNVSVETYRGHVLLSGFVDDEGQAKKALQLASSVEGVLSVKNGMAVK